MPAKRASEAGGTLKLLLILKFIPRPCNWKEDCTCKEKNVINMKLGFRSIRQSTGANVDDITVSLH